MIESNRIINNRILTTTPRYTMTAEQKALERSNRAPYPFLFNAKVDGTVCVNGSITNRYAGASGKFYTNSAGTLVNAAQNAVYVHHVWDSTTSTYKPVGQLWEPAVQNLFTQSETLAAGGLTPFRATAGADADTAPDGAATADRLIEDSTATNTHGANNAANTLTAASYIFGTFAKAGTRTKIELANNTLTKARGFDLSAGTTFATTIGGHTAPNDYGIIKLGSGWYYCWISFTGTAAAHDVRVYLNNGTAASYSGDGASYAVVWGHQLHLGAGPGSYIKSAGSAATRTADTASISSAWMNAGYKANGRKIYKYTPNGSTGSNNRTIADCRDGTTNGFQLYIDTAGKLSTAWNNTTLQSAALTWTPGTTYEIKIEWNAAGVVTLYVDGVSKATQSISALSTIGATFYLGNDKSNATQANGAVLEAYAEAL